MENILTFLNPETLLPLGMNVLKALVVLIIGLFIAKKVKQLIIKLGEKSPQLDDTLFKFLGSIARYIIMAFVFIAVLGMFGVETTSIVAIMGAASLAVGLALQGAMSNMAAGVMLMIFRPYKAGDFVEVAGIFGNVEEVELFTTILQTFDNQQIIIPNGKIWGSLSERSVEILVRPFTDGEHYFDVTYSVPEQIKAALGAAGMATPYPQTRIIMSKD